MAPKRIIYPDEGETLVGLQMSVSNYWCPGYLDNQLRQGRICGFLKDTNQYLLKLDDKNDKEKYPMRWDDVCKYVDVQAGTYELYHLLDRPVDLPPNLASLQQKVYRQTLSTK